MSFNINCSKESPKHRAFADGNEGKDGGHWGLDKMNKGIKDPVPQ